MHYKIKNTQIGKLIGQRNNAVLIICGLFILCFFEALTIYHLVDNQQNNFTPIPQVVTEPFSISRNHVSTGYLADMTRYFAMLRLNYTPATIADQAKWLLRYTDGAFYGAFKQQLSQEIEKTKEHDISLSFTPVDTQVDEKNMTVLIDGDLTEYVGKTRLPIKRVTYRLTYSYRNGQLRVTSMNDITGENIHA